MTWEKLLNFLCQLAFFPQHEQIFIVALFRRKKSTVDSSIIMPKYIEHKLHLLQVCIGSKLKCQVEQAVHYELIWHLRSQAAAAPALFAHEEQRENACWVDIYLLAASRWLLSAVSMPVQPHHISSWDDAHTLVLHTWAQHSCNCYRHLPLYFISAEPQRAGTILFSPLLALNERLGVWE